jgi:nuclear transport factor 2 (NTF2) superfamily protein
MAYTIDSEWRNRSTFVKGRDEIAQFLNGKWDRELEYRLIKEIWCHSDNRIAVRFAYEYHNENGDWFRAYGTSLSPVVIHVLVLNHITLIKLSFGLAWLGFSPPLEGNENWEFDENGLMAKRHASINDVPIAESERKFHWPHDAPRPDDHPGLTDLSL